MTDEELKTLVASLAVAQQETNRQFQETNQKFQETDRKFQETDRQLQELAQQIAKQSQEAEKERRETDKKLRELAQQIGGLGNKFGSFTEGMAFPSMLKLLTEYFGMEAITTNYKIKRHGEIIELDVFGHANGKSQAAVVVEIKSQVREEHAEQLLRQLAQLRQFLPEHAAKKFYGVLAGVHIPVPVQQKVWQQGLYLATLQEDLFQLQVPANFQARVF
jgi:hypothetical protein